MAVFQNEQITVVKDNGLVSHVFAESTLRALVRLDRHRPHALLDVGLGELDRRPTRLPLGRARRASPSRTTATSPTPPTSPRRPALEFTSMLSDSDLVAELLAREVDARRRAGRGARHRPRPRRGRLFHGDPRGEPDARGARSLRLSSALCLGRLGPEDAPDGWIVASESPALDVVGATFVREIAPGEMVSITEHGVTIASTARAGGGQAEALHLRVRLLRASRRLPHGSPGAHHAPSDGRAARRAVERRRPTW